MRKILPTKCIALDPSNFRGYEVVVPEDCVQAFTDKDHDSGLEYLKNIYEARIVISEDLSRE